VAVTELFHNRLRLYHKNRTMECKGIDPARHGRRVSGYQDRQVRLQTPWFYE